MSTLHDTPADNTRARVRARGARSPSEHESEHEHEHEHETVRGPQTMEPSPASPFIPIANRHYHTKQENIINTMLLILVAIPAIGINYWLSHNCPVDPKRLAESIRDDGHWQSYYKHIVHFPWSPTHTFEANVCNLYVYHPLWMVNIIYFVNVNLLFYLISLIQRSTWLIDPYWTFIPVMISHFFYSHPLAKNAASNPRALVAFGLIYLWALRLTHSYFRREEWNMGAREDWRFVELRYRFGKLWYLLSFVVVYLLQHVFLVGISLPMYVILDLGTRKPFNVVDIVLTVICLVAIVVAYFADTQLYRYMTNKPEPTPIPIDLDTVWHSVIAGGDTQLLLNSGLWYYSRHPNYFAEQLFWWSFSGFAVHVLGRSAWFYVLGAAFNSLCLIAVSFMVESRINRNKERVHIYKVYCETTSRFIPFIKFTSAKPPSARGVKKDL